MTDIVSEPLATATDTPVPPAVPQNVARNPRPKRAQPARGPARESFDQITGRAGVDDMLDALFGRFCLGK